MRNIKQQLRSPRLWTMWVAALLVVGWYYLTDPDGGRETLERIQWLAWVLVVSGPVYLLRRAFFPEARSGDAIRKAMEGSTGAGLIVLGFCILVGLLFLALSVRANASELPPKAIEYLPVLKQEATIWPNHLGVDYLAAQIEQETCPSLRSKKCWNPNTELKTDREYGFGLGQITITRKFNNFESSKQLDSTLRDWSFDDRFNAAKQMRVLILMDRNLNRRLTALIPDPHERYAMTLSAYNGGMGGVLSDRRLCAQHSACDPKKWFGHVEMQSNKAKSKVAGYGKSFYDINREYVRNVMLVRRDKYTQWLGRA